MCCLTKIIILMNAFKKSRKVSRLARKWRFLIQLRWMSDLKLDPIPSNLKYAKHLMEGKKHSKNFLSLHFKSRSNSKSYPLPKILQTFQLELQMALHKCFKTNLLLQNYPNYLISNVVQNDWLIFKLILQNQKSYQISAEKSIFGQDQTE